jgi:two-component system, NtrC family, response regulator HydG
MTVNSFEPVPGAIAQSPQMADVFSRLRRVAPYFRTVLITGETGTGKEVICRALHQLSPVARGNLVTLNCSAVVETLFESELFGHVRGAFTGADHDKTGQFEHAHGGSLFLDEIGDMPLTTQAKLLRVLQNQEIQRVGSLTPKKVDVHVIAATNKNLREAVRQKQFREDLYYRLSMVEISLPPLRDRRGDLNLLAEHFLRLWSARCNKDLSGISAEVYGVLASHSWPGNVRELENVIGAACMMARGDTLQLEDLPPQFVARPLPEMPALDTQAVPAAANNGNPDVLHQFEEQLLREALQKTRWNQSEAARVLGTTRDRLRYRMKKHLLLGTSKKKAEAACV